MNKAGLLAAHTGKAHFLSISSKSARFSGTNSARISESADRAMKNSVPGETVFALPAARRRNKRIQMADHGYVAAAMYEPANPKKKFPGRSTSHQTLRFS